MTDTALTALTASAAVDNIARGLVTSVDLVKACLARIEQTDGQLKAWAQVDAAFALAQAEELDAIRRSGRALGSLHGVPVGLKDIVDTRGLATERGSPIFAGRRPEADAAIVERLREAGAVILGKTVTTELAFLHPADTRNPHDPARTPGGSSSGSAAAVAAYQVPLAIGTQTNGSVIRPASFCGTYGFKPTRGLISRRGILQTSKSLDQVGVFGRSLEDVALLAEAIQGYDPADALSPPRPRPPMVAGCRSTPPVPPTIAWFELPFAERLSDDARAAMEEVLDALGDRVERLPSPPAFANLLETQRVIHEYEIVRHLDDAFSSHWDKVSTSLQAVVERGRAISDAEYDHALGTMAATSEFFDSFFIDYDAVITPAAAGEAPERTSGTGDPAFCTIWTLAGLPSLNLPLLVGANGLPVGVQLVGAVERDDRLMRTAGWLVNHLQATA